MGPKKLTIRGKFPRFNVLTLDDTDLIKDLPVSRMTLDIPAGDIPTATITAYVLDRDIEIYVKADITLEARYNGKIYRLVEVEPETTKGTQ